MRTIFIALMANLALTPAFSQDDIPQIIRKPTCMSGSIICPSDATPPAAEFAILAEAVLYDRGGPELAIKGYLPLPAFPLIKQGIQAKYDLECKTENKEDVVYNERLFTCESKPGTPNAMIVALHYVHSGETAQIHRAYIGRIGDNPLSFHLSDERLAEFLYDHAFVPH